MPLVHIAGPDVEVNGRLRQRCAWCGTILLDVDLTRIAVPEGTDPRPGTWQLGALIAVDGPASYMLPRLAMEPLPDNACAVLDAEVTR